MADPSSGERSSGSAPRDDGVVFEARRLDGAAWASLGAGAGLALVVLAVPRLRFWLSHLTILIHELGHAIFGWLFGYPSIPAFDFRYGGGITVHQRQMPLIVVIVYLLLVGLIAAYRNNRPTLVVLAFAVGAYALFAHTAAHMVLILFMGHGFELAIAGVFVYRAFSGSAVVHAAERPLYAACGLFIVLSDIVFAYGLWTSPARQKAYGAAKGGGHWMDFDRIAREYLHVEMPTVAFFFLACCFLTVALSFVVFRYQERIFDLLARLVQREPSE